MTWTFEQVKHIAIKLRGTSLDLDDLIALGGIELNDFADDSAFGTILLKGGTDHLAHWVVQRCDGVVLWSVPSLGVLLPGKSFWDSLTDWMALGFEVVTEFNDDILEYYRPDPEYAYIRSLRWE